MRYSVVGLALAFVISSAQAQEPVTYTKHVAAILWKNCAGCHRPGEVGPFSLLTYEDAVKRADFLKETTATRRMPPWKAEPGHGSFHDERRLTEAEIETIARWVDTGSERGIESDLPAAPKFPEGWQLGIPDLILEMPDPFAVPAESRDIFHCFVLPTGVTEETAVAAVEFRPGNPKVVHHALFFLDTKGEARKKDEAEPGLGYSGFGGPGFLPDGALGGWAPGASPRPLPDGYARRLPKNSDLVMQVHYHPSGKDEVDRSRVGIYFAKGKSNRYITGLVLRNADIRIPPGAPRYKRTASLTLPVGVQVVGISPHMHMVGREMKGDATLPDGRVEPLIWIRDWDFNWQGQYVFKNPLNLPKGTKVDLVAYYDNSSNNPSNPSDPPKLVKRGEQTTDEMCLCFMQVVPDDLAGYAALRRAMWLNSAAPKGLLERLIPADDQ